MKRREALPIEVPQEMRTASELLKPFQEYCVENGVSLVVFYGHGNPSFIVDGIVGGQPNQVSILLTRAVEQCAQIYPNIHADVSYEDEDGKPA
jgi:hypothetical protein